MSGVSGILAYFSTDGEAGDPGLVIRLRQPMAAAPANDELG